MTVKRPFETLSEEYPVRTCAADMNGLWRLSDILVQMQELAGKQCHLLGCGREHLLPGRGIVWVLTRSELRVRRMPELGETVTITTWAAPPRRTIYPRYFSITFSDGRPAIECATRWVLCDIRDRRMVNAPDIGAAIPTPDREPPFAGFTPVPAIPGEGKVWTMTPRYSDLDANGHVNNTRYADWLCDALGIDLLRQKRIAVFSVDYRREVMPGDEIRMTLRRDENGFSLFGARGDTPAFDIGGAFAADPAPGNDVRG